MQLCAIFKTNQVSCLTDDRSLLIAVGPAALAPHFFDLAKQEIITAISDRKQLALQPRGMRQVILIVSHYEFAVSFRNQTVQCST
ncbi:hypothetical protein GCM10008942_06750 [Rhizomicrobium electricum]|uniref:Uncharacterized protein n=1 Tax=Rhizomicrobium electricum TaxID=480070 RepID=A0ABP3PD02_9PROT